jgi:hypothetical protein
MKVKLFFNFIAFCCVLSLLSSIAHAGCEEVLSKSIGWTIIDTKIIAGWMDSGQERQDRFEGCDYGRTIYFGDGTSAICNSSGDQFLRMPSAIILGKSDTLNSKQFIMFKMIVGGKEYYLK